MLNIKINLFVVVLIAALVRVVVKLMFILWHLKTTKLWLFILLWIMNITMILSRYG